MFQGGPRVISRIEVHSLANQPHSDPDEVRFPREPRSAPQPLVFVECPARQIDVEPLDRYLQFGPKKHVGFEKESLLHGGLS